MKIDVKYVGHLNLIEVKRYMNSWLIVEGRNYWGANIERWKV